MSVRLRPGVLIGALRKLSIANAASAETITPKTSKEPGPQPIVIPVHNAFMPLNPDISSLYTVAKIPARRTRVSRSGREKITGRGQTFARPGGPAGMRSADHQGRTRPTRAACGWADEADVVGVAGHATVAPGRSRPVTWRGELVTLR